MATTDVEIRVVDDPAREAASVLAAASGQIALSGGGTVGRVYELAAARRLDWSGVHVWFGDDRAVPPGDERSNYRLVRTNIVPGRIYSDADGRVFETREAAEKHEREVQYFKRR